MAYSPDDLASLLAGRKTAHDALGITVEHLAADRVVLRVAVDWRVCEGSGSLHGGVSALLAESAATMGAALNVEAGRRPVGLELNASHLRPVRDGWIEATATPLRRGRTAQVWSVEVRDASDRLVCSARCTVSVINEVPDPDPRSPDS